MSGRPGAKKCDSCGGMKRVLSVSVSITHGLHSVRVPVLHLCEECIINAPDLAKIAHEIEGGTPTLAETLSPEGARPRTRSRVLFLLSDSIRAVYCRWRGVSA